VFPFRLTYDLSDVGVQTYVKYGVGLATPEKYTYSTVNNNDWDERYITNIAVGDGDGTVNRRSLEAGLKMGWEKCDHEAFAGEDHQSIVKNEKVLGFLVQLGVNEGLLSDNSFARSFEAQRQL